MNNPYSSPLAALENTPLHYTPTVFALNGRIGRLRLLAYSLALFGALTAGTILVLTAGLMFRSSQGVLDWVPTVLGLCNLLGVITLARRRLQDLDRSGALAVVLLVPLVGQLMLLWLVCAAGKPLPNRFGPAPSANTRAVALAASVLLLLVVVGGVLVAWSLASQLAAVGITGQSGRH
jgi:uncharacterized membrane protein YhaH (DUF805 family)